MINIIIITKSHVIIKFLGNINTDATVNADTQGDKTPKTTMQPTESNGGEIHFPRDKIKLGLNSHYYCIVTSESIASYYNSLIIINAGMIVL